MIHGDPADFVKIDCYRYLPMHNNQSLLVIALTQSHGCACGILRLAAVRPWAFEKGMVLTGTAIAPCPRGFGAAGEDFEIVARNLELLLTALVNALPGHSKQVRHLLGSCKPKKRFGVAALANILDGGATDRIVGLHRSLLKVLVCGPCQFAAAHQSRALTANRELQGTCGARLARLRTANSKEYHCHDS
jgi:hypothetical protein